MSKPSAKKTLRQQRKSRQRKSRQRKFHQENKHITQNSSISPNFPAERIGAPAAGASWLGRKVASLLKIR